jgi:hypothetical protein
MARGDIKDIPWEMKISEFLEIAIKNIVECQEDPKFKLNMGFLIQPVSVHTHKYLMHEGDPKEFTIVCPAGAVAIKTLGHSPRRTQDKIYKLPTTSLTSKEYLCGLFLLSEGRFEEAEKDFRVAYKKNQMARDIGKSEGLSYRKLTARVKELLGDDIPECTHLTKMATEGDKYKPVYKGFGWYSWDLDLFLMGLQTIAEFYKLENL